MLDALNNAFGIIHFAPFSLEMLMAMLNTASDTVVLIF
jgi:hypothetical protein